MPPFDPGLNIASCVVLGCEDGTVAVLDKRELSSPVSVQVRYPLVHVTQANRGAARKRLGVGSCVSGSGRSLISFLALTLGVEFLVALLCTCSTPPRRLEGQHDKGKEAQRFGRSSRTLPYAASPFYGVVVAVNSARYFSGLSV